jgi:DNA (cytosine-5)-methyltransferase 1
MKFGSVCSGIEAASVAFNPLGWEAAWFAEIEAFPGAVLAHHYPHVENVGDMTKIVEMLHTFQLDAPDMLCGGTPCQAFSVAGLRNSLDDARGNLSLTFCEIANAIDTTRLLWGEQPAIIFWENVPGVLSTKDNAFGCFLAGLAGEDDALVAPGGKWTDAGYVHGPQRTVAWRTLDAQYFGLAQRRKRVFVVASAREGFDPAKVLFEFDGLRRDTAPSREARQEVAGSITQRIDRGGVNGEGGDNHIVPSVAPTLDGRAGRSGETSFATSGGLVPSVAQCLTTRTGQRYDPETETILPHTAHTLRGEGFDASEDGTGRGTPLVPVGFTQNQRDEVRMMHVAGALAAEPGAKQQTYVAQPISFGAQMSVPQVDFNVNQTLQAKNPMAVALPINTMIALRHEALGERTGFGIGSETDPAFTVTKGHSHAVAFTAGVDYENNGHEADEPTGPLLKGLPTGGGRPLPAISLPTMQVRRLTPVECARLQGFPDTYLDITYRKKPAADGPKYKALGNSWAVPVVRWIGERIKAAL